MIGDVQRILIEEKFKRTLIEKKLKWVKSDWIFDGWRGSSKSKVIKYLVAGEI